MVIRVSFHTKWFRLARSSRKSRRLSSSVMHIILVRRTGYGQITIVADPTEIAENPGIIPIGFNCNNMCCEPMRHWAVTLALHISRDCHPVPTSLRFRIIHIYTSVLYNDPFVICSNWINFTHWSFGRDVATEYLRFVSTYVSSFALCGAIHQVQRWSNDWNIYLYYDTVVFYVEENRGCRFKQVV